MRVVRAIAIGLVVVVATGALTVAGLTWLPGILVASADATPEAQVWPVATVERQVPRPVPPVERITIAAVGDLMAHMPQVTSASVTGGYDFTPCFAFVEPEISSADLAIGNLETTLAGADRGFSGYPTFNTPDEFAQAAAGAGFDVLTTANNHVLDRGPSGVERTLDILDGLGVRHTGSARTASEAERILVEEVRGVTVAVLAYTYGMNGFTAPADKPWMVNVIDEKAMADAVRSARPLADIVIVSIHNGVEYRRQPSERQRALEEAMIEAGADVVLGSHPHVIQPMETLEVTGEDGAQRTGFIIHSLGNFVSNQRERYRNTGLVLRLGFEKDLEEGVTTLSWVEYVPVWVDDTDDSGREHRVLPIRAALDDPECPGVTSDDRARMQQAWDDTTGHLGGTPDTSGPGGRVLFYGDPGTQQP